LLGIAAVPLLFYGEESLAADCGRLNCSAFGRVFQRNGNSRIAWFQTKPNSPESASDRPGVALLSFHSDILQPAITALNSAQGGHMAVRHEIAFIDPSISDLETFLAGLRPEVEAIVLDPAVQAPAQMARALNGRSDLDAIHIVAHGRPGEVSFGAGALSLESIADYADELAEIGQSVGKGGDLLLWSCSTALAERGSDFVAALAAATGAGVAASADLVGAAALGGRWALEVESGAVGARPPLTMEGVERYAGVMNTIGFNLNETNFNYVIGTTQQIAPAATFTDSGNGHFDHCALTVSLPTGDTTDVLGISNVGGITTVGTHVFFNGTDIGTYSFSTLTGRANYRSSSILPA